VAEADLLLHVVDVSNPHALEQIKAVEVVLHEIEAWGKPTVVALNKIDRLPDGDVVGRADPARQEGDSEDGRLGEPSLPTTSILDKFLREIEHAVPISAKKGTNLDALLQEISNQLHGRRVNVTLSIPADKAKTIALVYRSGYVTARTHEEGKVILQAQIPKVLAGELTPYVVESGE
jgi:GTP-binding protein HflX